MSASPKTILAIGAHLDDAIIGAGGVLLQAVDAGCRVVIISVVSDFSTRAQTRGHEQATIDELLALSAEVCFDHRLLGKPYHQVLADDLELKKQIAQIVAEVKPDVGFIHHHEDHWPDHRACAVLGQDALMFTHGLTENLSQRYCPLVYAFDLTPRQTYSFTPDAFYDVEPVLPRYMNLIRRVDSCAQRRTPDDLVCASFSPSADQSESIALSVHGMLRLSDCIRHGDLGGCRFALGFRTVWGDRRGPALW